MSVFAELFNQLRDLNEFMGALVFLKTGWEQAHNRSLTGSKLASNWLLKPDVGQRAFCHGESFTKKSGALMRSATTHDFSVACYGK
jgi:hypothetical protein